MNQIPIQNKIPELDVAIDAAIKAGNIILEIYDKEYEKSTKSDDSPITEADLKSNEIIKKILSKTRHVILSEEDKDDHNRLSKETIWIYKNTQITLEKTIKPQKSVSDLIDILQSYTPTIIKKASFYKVIHGTRPQMYGWQLFFIKL